VKTYDFVCDARISISVEADSPVEARKTWDRFAQSLLKCGEFIGTRCGSFYVMLQNLEPRVYDAETGAEE